MKSLNMCMNKRISQAVSFLLATTLAAAATAQPAAGARGAPAGGRGGAAPAAAASTGRGGRLSDPRPAFEQVEARIKKIDEAELKEPPKRDYQVEVGPAQKTKLFRAD